jgi:16S rRNA (cytosine967-C5)-methyltransferase
MARKKPMNDLNSPGFAARRVAAAIIDGVIRRHLPLDDQLEGERAHPGLAGLAARDRALTRLLVATVLRRLGTLRHLLGLYLDQGPPKDAPAVETALFLGAAQILWLDVPNHAAVDLAVQLTRADRRDARYAGLVNAVLRRISESGAERLAGLDSARLDTPDWLMTRWIAAYGETTARAIATANGTEPGLDLSVKQDPEHWALTLGGRVLPTGSVRLIAHGPVPQLPGFDEGAWWVQDAAAALPVRLFGAVAGQRIADLCAAPGGKTAQLAAAGADVVAVDRSPVRLERVRQNLARLGLNAETIAADVTQWLSEPFDAVLLDAPCSSTGTIRRHPDVPWLKREADITTLAALQRRLLDHAVGLVKPGGLLVFCTCSLEPEESIMVVEEQLARDPRVTRRPIAAGEGGIEADWLTPAGDLRTLPYHLGYLGDPDPRMGGLDGFYAARLVRS